MLSLGEDPLRPEPATAPRPSPAPTDAALVVSARAGEAWASEALFRRHARMAGGLAFRLLGRDDEVDDVVQDAYVEALSGLHRLEQPQAFAGFLAGIVVRRVRRTIRRRSLARRLGLVPRAEPVDLDGLVDPAAPADVRAELRAIYGLVDRLPSDERLALVLRRVEGLPLEEVAALSGCSLATVKRRLASADRRMAEALGPGDPGEGRAE